MKTRKILILTITAVLLFIFQTLSFAGMADWDDKAADEETNKLLEEQKNEFSQIENKSSNNYLDSLEIEGFTLSPEFDKQTVEYDIGDVKTEKLEVKAIAEDEKAKIDGTGTVTLVAGNNDIKVEVTSESGTTRTYHIKANCASEKAEEPAKNEDVVNEISANKETNMAQQTEENSSSQIRIFIAVAIVVLIAIFLIFKKK